LTAVKLNVPPEVDTSAKIRVHRSVGAETEAEACFLKAREIACRQQARSLELRVVMSWSRLRQQQGTQKDAHQLLREIYTWFTERFETADRQERKALLAELS